MRIGKICLLRGGGRAVNKTGGSQIWFSAGKPASAWIIDMDNDKRAHRLKLFFFFKRSAYQMVCTQSLRFATPRAPRARHSALYRFIGFSC
jgi:hypothetical protein